MKTAGCLLAFVVLSASGTFAELIESRETVLDTETGLEWLKFWHGTEMSVNQMVQLCATECFGPGYRYATTAEFEELKEHFTRSRFRDRPADDSWLRTFTFMFGDTLYEDFAEGERGFAAWNAFFDPREGVAAYATGQWYSIIREPLDPSLPLPGYLYYGPVPEEAHGVYDVNDPNWLNLGLPDIGHILVRQTQFTDEKLSVRNGDSNGDGVVDISDVVSTLLFLFKDGEHPSGCDDVPGLLARAMERVGVLQNDLFRARARANQMEYARDKCLAAVDVGRIPGTGLLACVNPQGEALSCSDASACPGQDAQGALPCFAQNRFEESWPEGAFDSCTRLTWHVQTVDVNADGQLDASDQLAWCEALEYCQTQLAGAGWRVPNIKELESVVDFGRTSPAIDPLFEAVPAHYWSSTPRVGVAGAAWSVNFEDGSVGVSTAPCFLRVVRDRRF